MLSAFVQIITHLVWMEHLFCLVVVYCCAKRRNSLYGRRTVVDLALAMNTLYITDRVIDEHLFHYEGYSSSRKLSSAVVVQCSTNWFKQGYKHKHLHSSTQDSLCSRGDLWST